MNLPSGKAHLTSLDILIELRGWLADNVEMQAEPAIVAHCLAAASNEGTLALLEQAVTKARDDEVYATQFEETLLQGSTIEIRECLSCFGDYFERSRDTPPYYPHHDAVNGIDSMPSPSCSMPLTPTLS